jgi:hypothetical protein
MLLWGKLHVLLLSGIDPHATEQMATILALAYCLTHFLQSCFVRVLVLHGARLVFEIWKCTFRLFVLWENFQCLWAQEYLFPWQFFFKRRACFRHVNTVRTAANCHPFVLVHTNLHSLCKMCTVCVFGVFVIVFCIRKRNRFPLTLSPCSHLLCCSWQLLTLACAFIFCACTQSACTQSA